MEKTNRFKNLVGFGWKTRHLLAIILAVAGTYAFLELRAQWSEMHRWNRAIGDMSMVLVAFSMAIGPLSRLFPMFRKLIPFRRELGIYGVILGAIHTMIILIGWVNWDFWRLFGFEFHPAGVYVMVQQGFGMANVIGIIALVYGLVLALSSSNWSQKLLGASVWKFLQQSAYVLWMLIVIHTAYFLYFHFLDYHKNTPEPNILQIPFAILVSTILVLQIAAFFKTWKLRRNRVMSDQTPLTD
ncbi:hypothetical protein MNBD_ALPHA11-158 [hydrothermal vent metagenome]|uniref:Ferric oxidoreductase domain-containing protein n=1 Tax=hydrothermal vent metagenome TaxID=652676 RepID=A0A3B0UYC0_9ZZZZ